MKRNITNLALIALLTVLTGGQTWGQAVIGTSTGNNTNGSTADPIERYYNYEHFQIIYTAAELTAGGMSSGSSVTAFGFAVSQSAVSLGNFTIKMGLTMGTSVGTTGISAGLTTVKNPFTYAPTVTTATTFDMITLDNAFVWDGSSNIVVDICTGSNPFTTPYGGTFYTSSAAGSMGGIRTDGASNCSIFTGTQTVGSSSFAWTSYAYRPNTRFNYTGGSGCIAPTIAAASNITTNSATINWTAPATLPSGGYQYEVRTSGAAGSGATGLAASGNTAAGVTTANITGLSASTSYTVYVRSFCGGTNYSAWSTGGTFTTLCAPTALPITEGFNSTTIPACWSKTIVAVQTASKITFVASASNPATTPYEGADMVLYNAFSNAGGAAGSEERLVSLPLNSTSVSSVDVKFYWRNNNNTSYNAGAYLNEGVQVQYSINGGSNWIDAPGGFFARHDASLTAGTAAWKQKTVTLPAAAGNVANLMVGFKFHSEYGDNMFMDLVNIAATPTCAAPTAVTATANSTTAASVTFTGTGSSFIVEYGAPGFTPGTGAAAGTGGTVVTGTASPIALSGLTANTSYQVYVRQVCSGPTYSANSVVTSFFTGYCVPSSTSQASYLSDFTTSNGATNINYTAAAGVAPGYQNLSATTKVSNYIGNTTNVSLTAAGPTVGFAIWVDWNQDFLFSSTERVFVTSGYVTTTTGSFTIPAGTALGNYRLRVATDFNNSAPSDPCAVISRGDYVDFTFEVVAMPTCFAPTAITAANTTATSTNFSFTAPASGTPANYEYEVRSSGAAGSGATGLIASGTTTSTTITGINGLSANTTYTIYVRTFCGGTDFSAYGSGSFTTPIVNDNATGAVTITVGATCTGAPFSNANASAGAGEPVPSCANSATGYRTVWYKFVAPAGGAVRVSMDYTDGGTLSDTRAALYSATNVSDYTTFTSIACDDDNGVINGARALLYAADLTPGTTYYVEVDNYSAGNGGTYCLTVDAVNDAMLVASGTCVALTTTGGNAYTGYRSLVSSTGQLGALVRQAAGTTGSAYTSAVTVNSGAVRSNAAVYSSIYYLDRNFLLNSTSNTPGDVKLFFKTTELNALVNQNGSNVNGITDLAITRQTGSTCQANYATANGTETTLPASTSGSTGGVSWLSFTTPGFSNFYISAQAQPLPVEIVSIQAENAGATNRVQWTSGAELNVATYEVEKSRNGQDFEPMATVSAQGNNSRYESVDNTPNAGLTYYRVRNVDADGTYRYSKTVSAFLNSNGEAAIQAFPNPMSSALTVTVFGAQGGDVQLTDLSGRVIAAASVANGQATFNTQSLAAGVYFVKWTNGSLVKTLKVTKQ